MTAEILAEAEDDLERAFTYYEQQRPRLGHELLEEFRHGVNRILEHPEAWQAMDALYRRYRLHRFPFGIVYRADLKADQIIIVAVMHLSRRPGHWSHRG